jgi:glycosyltransferase involved in cell wall biosynthesis
MKIIIYHPQGNANVRASAAGLAEADLLQEFHTSIAVFPGSFLDVVAGAGILPEFRRRRFDETMQHFTRSSPAVELARLFSSKAGLKNLVKHETGRFSVDAVTRYLDKKVAASLTKARNKGVGGVYAYEDAATLSFHEAKRLGLKCFYDLPTGYWRAKLRILELEKQRFPEWQNTFLGLRDSQEKLARKDEEIRLADRIFVASQFTAHTLKDFPGTLPPVDIVPYGFPEVSSHTSPAKSQGSGPLKLLFVGNLSQQKGIANLFQAMEGLEKYVRLTLVGRKATEDCEALNSGLAKHRFIPGLPHHEILKIMREHDVLVFPTLFDGFGLVISEAMSQGTPVIATYNSAGPDLIEDGRNGWLVEAGSTQSLKATIEKLVGKPELIRKAGIEAGETARLRPWSVFRQELSNAINRPV